MYLIHTIAILVLKQGFGGKVPLPLAKHTCVKFKYWALACSFSALPTKS